MKYPFHWAQQQYICPNSVSSPFYVLVTDIIYLMFGRDQKLTNMVKSNF